MYCQTTWEDLVCYNKPNQIIVLECLIKTKVKTVYYLWASGPSLSQSAAFWNPKTEENEEKKKSAVAPKWELLIYLFDVF